MAAGSLETNTSRSKLTLPAVPSSGPSNLSWSLVGLSGEHASPVGEGPGAGCGAVPGAAAGSTHSSRLKIKSTLDALPSSSDTTSLRCIMESVGRKGVSPAGAGSDAGPFTGGGGGGGGGRAAVVAFAVAGALALMAAGIIVCASKDTRSPGAFVGAGAAATDKLDLGCVSPHKPTYVASGGRLSTVSLPSTPARMFAVSSERACSRRSSSSYAVKLVGAGAGAGAGGRGRGCRFDDVVLDAWCGRSSPGSLGALA